MAKGDVAYRLLVDSRGAVKNLQIMEAEFKKAGNAARQFGKQTDKVNNKLGTQERSANLAGAAALELSRVASDAAYGLRGMANNIGQIVTMFSMMIVSTDAATGATLGFSGAMKALWRAVTGPLGVVIAIQGLLSLLTVFEARAQKAKSAQDDLNESMQGRQARGIKTLASDVKALGEAYQNLDGRQQKKAAEELDKLIPKWRELSDEGENFFLINQKLGRLKILQAQKDQLETELAMFDVKNANELMLEAAEKKQTKINETVREQLEIETELFGLRADNKKKKKDGDFESLVNEMEAYFTSLEMLEDQSSQLTDRFLSDIEQRQSAERKALMEQIKNNNMRALEEGSYMAQRENLEANHLAAIEQMRQRHYLELDQLRQENADKEVAAMMKYADQQFAQLDKINERERQAKIRHDQQMKDLWGRAGMQIVQSASDIFSSIQDMRVIDMQNEYNARLQNAKTQEEYNEISAEMDKALFEERKKANIATALIDTMVAATKTYAALAANPPAAIAATAAVVAAGLARVEAIRRTEYGGGKPSFNETGVGGSGDLEEVSVVGFSNLSGGESPYGAIRVNVLEHDVRSVGDKVHTTKVRARL